MQLMQTVAKVVDCFVDCMNKGQTEDAQQPTCEPMLCKCCLESIWIWLGGMLTP